MLQGTSAERNGGSLREYVEQFTEVEPFGRIRGMNDSYQAKCILPGCEDQAQSLYIFSDGNQELFECYECARNGGLDDFEVLMNSNGAALLESLTAFVRRYVVLSDEQADVIALWVVHTHAFAAADTTPYLEVTSAEKRSGKSRLLEVLDTVVARAWYTGRVTSAVLVRKVAGEQPALLLDESDAAFKGDREYAETLRGVLNAGFRRGGKASLCVGQGANITYEDFPVFSPKAIAGIGKLPDTVSDRAIKIELRRRARSEKVERFRLRKVKDEAEKLRDGAAAWAEAHMKQLTGHEPELPEELDDRAQDIAEALLAIAEVVGGKWPERARKGVIKLAGAAAREDSESLGIRLLRDIRTVFGDSERLHTATILKQLHAEDSWPWAHLGGEGLDARGLARLLKPYRVHSKQVRIAADSLKGYEREDFEDAWERYCPLPDPLSETAKHPAYRAENPVSDVSGVSDKRNSENPHRNADVSHVSDNQGGEGESSRNVGASTRSRAAAGCARSTTLKGGERERSEVQVSPLPQPLPVRKLPAESKRAVLGEAEEVKKFVVHEPADALIAEVHLGGVQGPRTGVYQDLEKRVWEFVGSVVHTTIVMRPTGAKNTPGAPHPRAEATVQPTRKPA
jgi:hypothetical protein